MSTETLEKPEEITQYDTIEKLTEAIHGNKKLVNEYADLTKEYGEEGEAKFLSKYLSKPKEEGVAQEEPAAQTPEDAPKEEAEITKEEPVKASNEDADKRAKELERSVETLRNSRTELEEKLRKIEAEKKALEDSFAESRRKADEAMKSPLPEEVTLDDIGDDFDILDTENQKKLVGKFKKLGSAYNSLMQQLKEVKGAAAQASEDAKLARVTNEDLKEQESEISEIDSVRRENPELFSKRPIKEIEDDFHAFMAGLGTAIGFKGVPVRDGVWAKEIQDAYQLYHDKEKGKDIIKKTEEEGLKLPEDFDDLIIIHKLRNIKNENQESEVIDGRRIWRPWNYRKALDYLGKSSTKPDPKIEKVRDKREAEERAVQNRQRFAKEIAPDKGANPIDITKSNDVEFQLKLRKYMNAKNEPPAEDREWLEAVMKATGLGPDEISATLNIERKQKRK